MDLSKDERNDLIIEYLKEGLSTRKTGEKVGVSEATVSNVAKAKGYDILSERTKAATKCSQLYNKAGRIALIDEGMNKLHEMLPTIDKAKDLQNWSISLGILCDKRRLEDAGKDNEKGGEIVALFKAMEEDNGSPDSKE